MNVAVTAVGGGVGQSIVKALQETEYSVVGVNSEVLGVGCYATTRSYLGPYAADLKFADRLLEICSKEKCRVLFPGIDAELAPLSNNVKKFSAEGIIPVISDKEVIDIAGDKLETSRFLEKNNFPHPQTFKLKDFGFELDFPIVLKPQKGGHRSIGQLKVNNRKEFDWYTSQVNLDNYVVQEFIEGEEYTCGTVSLEECCVGVILMKRELRNGDTVKAFVVKDEKLAAFIKRVINTLKPFGACNVQLKVRNDVPYVFEFNARCSGTTASRALAGFNEPKMICDYIFRGIKKPTYKISEIVILRYWKELVVSYDKINEMRSNGFIRNRKVEL
jgi:carbamoyl-phosphate synthase large subunit